MNFYVNKKSVEIVFQIEFSKQIDQFQINTIKSDVLYSNKFFSVIITNPQTNKTSFHRRKENIVTIRF